MAMDTSLRREAPTPGQVRDYVLTMLDGLGSLAEAAGDDVTRDQMRDFADHLIRVWSPRLASLPGRDF